VVVMGLGRNLERGSVGRWQCDVGERIVLRVVMSTQAILEFIFFSQVSPEIDQVRRLFRRVSLFAN
jgi:hypothetical protein